MESLTSTPEPSLSNELRALINQRNILTEKSKSKGGCWISKCLLLNPCKIISLLDYHYYLPLMVPGVPTPRKQHIY